MSLCKKRRRGLLLLAALVIIGWSGYRYVRYVHRTTDGFSLAAISAPLANQASWAIQPLPTDKQQQVDALLRQCFTYFAHGGQSYVFLSDDGRYVLKLCKLKHLGTPWYADMVNLPMIGPIVKGRLIKRERKLRSLFDGIKLAYEEMSADTGVLYIHLNTTSNLPHALTIVNKQGDTLVVDPNELTFYLQATGTPLFDLLIDYKRNHNLAGAQAALVKTFDYLVDRSHRGILDIDTSYPRNLGFIGDRAGNLDVGNLVRDPLIRNPLEYRRRIRDNMAALRVWIEEIYPELVASYDALIEKV